MSKVKIQGNASGTGVVTLTAPNTNTDRTITLPDSSDTLVSTAPSTSGNILTSDGTNWTSAAAGADTSLSNLTATGENKVCQAWVNFNGTGTVAIRDSYNVSSITDIGAGDQNINFTNALANANYAVATAIKNGNSLPHRGTVSAQISGTPSTGAFKILTAYGSTAASNGNYNDSEIVNAIVFGD
jgi:hypothetical protein